MLADLFLRTKSRKIKSSPLLINFTIKKSQITIHKTLAVIRTKEMGKKKKNKENFQKDNNCQILALKSRELLTDQINSVDTNNSKAGTFISISSLFIPLAFSLFEKFELSIVWILIFFIPIILNLIGLFFLVKALFPRKIYHGINFNEFQSLIEKSEDEIYLFEIGINRDSFNDNKITINEQNKNLKTGLSIIFLSAGVLTLIIFVNLLITNCN
ncbi:hypothetical protein [uncultured Tenacibaculum sp.]|uniref:hypothetical protein n=1 Tax=uncultured Tenacibaculum sp. TaxID=174713 RepID=UPI00262F276C|nr:hypothetical protein [uncultured Tenacibaculum sp.]